MLICGHLTVYWPSRRVGCSSIGLQLGIGDSTSVERLGKTGMWWSQLLPLLHDCVFSAGVPSQDIVVYSGKNDLGNGLAFSLLSRVLWDFETHKH